MTSVAELRQLLEPTSLPTALVHDLLDEAPALWLMSEAPSVLATDLALCHPPLAEEEIRAVARPTKDASAIRLAVVAHDRPGLLADTAAVLAAEGRSVISASAVTWTSRGLAMHALTFEAPPDRNPVGWDVIGQRLRAVAGGKPPVVPFTATGMATVECTPQPAGRTLLTVAAPDQIGLLWAICRWLAGADVTIEAAHVGGKPGTATDVFVVDGAFDPAGLAEHLSAPAPPPR